MYLPTLYKRGSTDAIQQWTIEIDGPKYRTIAGQQGGKLTITEWTNCEPKNTGRSNETTEEEQALIEAKAKWKKKSEKGYVQSVSDVDKSGFMQVMLAQNYADRVDEIDFDKGVVVSPKLDGVRCIVNKDGMWSREGKSLLAGSPHIHKILSPLFAADPALKLDGELYQHQFKENFDKIISLVKQQKPTPAELEESARLVQYWIFDCVNDHLSWNTRFVNNQELCRFLQLQPDSTIRMLHNRAVSSPKDIDDAFKKYRKEGFEGAMVRWDICGITYEHKRSKYLLKYKDFVTDEFEIVDILTGRGNKADKAAKAVCKDKRGIIFETNIEGSWHFCEQLLADKSKVIGKQGTIRYQNLTPKEQVPRIGYLIAIRDYE